MSPALNSHRKLGGRFPRVSGDEPAGAAGVVTSDQFSPRERG